MSRTTSSDPLAAVLDRLARFESRHFPVLSVYLDARPDSRGKDHYQPFLRKELAFMQRTYPLRSPARQSFDRDMAKIQEYLGARVVPSSNGIAIFACSGEADFFEPLQLDVAVESQIAVGSRPNVFPLARLLDENPRYALVLADTTSARIFVFAHGRPIDEKALENENLPRTGGSGTSQMHYQRHVENHQKEHARELVENLARIVEAERIDFIVLAGNDVILPLIRRELPRTLADRVVDTALRFDKKKPVADILAAAEGLLRERDARTDEEKAARLLDAYRSGGLAEVGMEPVRRALERGQADELLVSAALDRGAPSAGEDAADLVALARRTDTRVTFIENATLLEPVEGVGALLRYRVSPPPA
jgi:peptide subunit release factor 1 (eRF1)